MPDSPDDPTSPSPAERGEEASQTVTPAEDISADHETQSADESVGETPRPRRRRRRRPRQPPLDQPAVEQRSQAEHPAAAAEGATSGDGAPPAQRRRRRRRHGPRHDVGLVTAQEGQELQPAESAPQLSEELASPGVEAGAPVPSEALGEVMQGPAAQSDSKPEGPLRRRRRRRRGPRPGETPGPGAAAGEAGQAAGEAEPGAHRARTPPTSARLRSEHQAGGSSTSEAYRGPRTRGPRQRRRPGEGQPDRRPQHSDARERGRAGDRPGSAGGRFEGRDRDTRERSRGRDRSGRAEGRRGRRRDEPRKEPERRLYALESVVDRGFEDVTDEAGDNETRRVHWTILKRMVADQNSGKAISAVYVLQRDGVDTEFPSLGTARAAANKTIIHPEKLTLSKAEHAAAKGDGAAPERTRRQR
jgi:hypothetical protein